ncbi:YTH domain-containing protein ECT2 isoform X2 [Musa acuminata AAA Group]|uniref:YTH domain-containing protein ECT2 isoform X2 n=1 Tax=Musa acuminata AAA Group TaxID=214697 RepID=UPI0031E29BD5
MAAVALAADQASDLLQKLSLDSPPKTDNAVEVAKEPRALQNGSSDCETPNMPIQSERSLTPLLPDFVDPSMCYVPGGYASPAYFYGGYDRAVNKWGDYSRYTNNDGVEILPGKNAPVSRMYPINRFYGGNGLGNVFGYGFNGYDHRMNGRWGPPLDSKYNPRGRGNGFFGYGNEIQDGFSELNRGPRAGRSKNQKAAGTAPVFDLKGQNLSSIGNENSSVTLDREQYNGDDFPDKHSDARFFVIKSYSEDDIHKSIKYNVWTSTPNGNKKLDGGYQEAQEKDGGCPVFLFYSVNASGQFVGVAEMVGPVDFNKTVDYWQQDKWIGCFPVKWHIIKDVPNSLLKHITLENNDNKPVTNSRDTQEVRLEQGLQMLKIFKEHVSKTSVLDDFDFYENRQNFMQEKRVKQQLQKQVWTGKASHAPREDEQDRTNGKPGSQPVSVLNKESAQGSLGEINTPVELGVAAAAGAPLKVLKPAVEKHVVANGVANGVA